MAGINDTIKQCNFTVDYNKFRTDVEISYIGTDTNIQTLASTYRVGSTISNTEVLDLPTSLSGIVSYSHLEKIESDRSKWTVKYNTKTSSSNSGADEEPLATTFQMSMAQYEYPLERLFLSSETTGDSGAWAFESWKNMTDLKHKRDYKYLSDMSQTGAIYTSLNGKAKDLAELYIGGTESFLRFYPQITRQRTWDEKKENNLESTALGKIDTTPNDTQKFKILEEFQSSNYQWLKTGFDWAENQDGSWTLTESWLGAPEWSDKLYENA